MDYAALKTEIAKPEYAGMTDAEIAEAINGKVVAVKVDVPSDTVRGTLYARGAWRQIVSLSLDAKNSDPVHDAALVAAVQLVDFCRAGGVFSTSNGAILAQTAADLDALEAGDIITADDKMAVLALADASVPLWKSFGVRPLDFNDIAIARSA